MAAENGQNGGPRMRQKKKSALTKLVERKKRQAGDADSEYGSRISLQGNNQENTTVPQTGNNQGNSTVPQTSGVIPLEPEVIVEKKPSSRGGCVPCKSVSSTEQILEKPRPKPRRHSRTTSSDDIRQLEQTEEKEAGNKHQNGVQSQDAEPNSNRSGPTDSTIYRFRNMRMAPEQPENTDGKLQGPFMPKPPSTPRTPRAAAVKGEKRNHEHSSGEEAEVDSKRLTPNLNGERLSRDSSRQAGSERTNHNHLDKVVAENGIAKPKSSSRRSSVNSHHVDPANETINQLHSQYEQLMDADSTKDSPLHLRRDSSGSHHKDAHSQSGSTPRSGRLAPLEPKNMPPPLESDVIAHALRTVYKTDPGYRPRTTSAIGRLTKRMLSDGAMSHGINSPGKAASDNMSLGTASVLPVISTKEARSRSYLHGSVSSSTMSIMGSEELERYFPDRRCQVFVGSWNMNELKNLSISLDDFLLPESCDYVQDIYAIGTQENDMNRKEWEIRIQETLGPSHVLYHSVSYGSLHLAIFVRRDLIWFCSAPEDDIVSLRAVAMVKTKGAIGISFSMFGTSFLFINCHLTSDRTSSKNKHRLLDYHRVTSELRLPHIPQGKHVHPALKLADVTARFDCVFWCGDLNFRLERRRNAVEGRVSEYNDSDAIPHFEELLSADQLSKYITEGKIFEGFQEGRINFQPTFKFDLNTDKYDSSSKMRIPSYTDRVLFRSRKKNQIACLDYDAVMNIKVSDHRAVFARFEVMLRPGRDNIAMCAGLFDRDVYVEANKRRAQTEVGKGPKSSSVCTIQ